jgi:hypothetical protein
LEPRREVVRINMESSLAWWHTPVFPALRRLKQEDGKLVSLVPTLPKVSKAERLQRRDSPLSDTKALTGTAEQS